MNPIELKCWCGAWCRTWEKVPSRGDWLITCPSCGDCFSVDYNPHKRRWRQLLKALHMTGRLADDSE